MEDEIPGVEFKPLIQESPKKETPTKTTTTTTADVHSNDGNNDATGHDSASNGQPEHVKDSLDHQPPTPSEINLGVLKISESKSKPVSNADTNKIWVEKLDVNEEIKDYNERIKSPAFTYPFELDTFQKQAILCLENHDNVFVAAHTSAGKTVVAEYAIAMSLRRNLTKVIYTSPIKALSNQKFRDFKLTFGSKNVGILTGDVQIQPEAPCLVMTTEILLQMLYNSSDVIRDLEWVIFDEVHYCNDVERGHVWEKIFILLPDHISLVLLSATVSNIPNYAEWLGRTRQKKIFVISTMKRPVPLEHFLYIGKGSSGKEEKFLFVDMNNKLVQSGYNEALTRVTEREEKARKKSGGGHRPGPGAERSFYVGMIRHLEADDKLPAIIFTFSRKRCDENGHNLSSAIDLTTALEKGRIHRFIDKSLSKLSAADRQIRQVKDVINMLKRGFGVHHSGILPILKEITEILFAENLVRVLFATETFAMGVNMPARSVAFDSTEKFDSYQKRNLLPSEYIQMAGRAGRRGKDTTGTVLVCVRGQNKLPELSELNKMALGKPPELVSQFKLTYSMILNLLRIRQHQIEAVMGKSFVENGKNGQIKDLEGQKFKLQSQLESMPSLNCDHNLCTIDLESFCATYHQQYWHVQDIVMAQIMKAAIDSKKILIPGRLILYDSSSNPFTIGIVTSSGQRNKSGVTFSVVSIDVLELVSHGLPDDDLNKIKSLKYDSVNGANVHMIYVKTFKDLNLDWINLERDLRNNVNKSANVVTKSNEMVTKSDEMVTKSEDVKFENADLRKLLTSLIHYLKEFSHEVPIVSYMSLFQVQCIDVRKEFGKKLSNINFVTDLDAVNNYRNQLMQYLCTDCPSFVDHFNIYYPRYLIEEQLKVINFKLSPESMEFLPEYRMRLKVLEQLGYINSECCLNPKGHVSSLFKEHELVMTEMIFENELSKLDTFETAAILSAFVYQDANKKDVSCPTPAIESVVKSIKDLAASIGNIQQKCGMIHYPVQDFIDELHFGLLNITYQWASGIPFKDIVENVDIQEGIIVRTLQRLDEVLKDVQSAAKLFGDENLAAKMEDTSKAIRRDIVFAASLYTIADPKELDVELE